jgi:hypothetical protein
MASLSPRIVLCAFALGASATGCAAIWGFQDAVDLRDASTAEAEAEASTADATATDASSGDPRDATLDSAQAEAEAPDAASADEPPAGDASDEAASACTGPCMPSPDGGWVGPFSLLEVRDGGTCGPCGGGWTEAWHLGAAPSAPAASCDCRCGAPGNVTCSAPAATFWNSRFCNVQCAGPGAQGTIGACTSLMGIEGSCGPNTHFTLGTSVPDGGSCVSTAIVDAAAPTWGAELRLCAPTAPGACAAGTCFPQSDPDAASVAAPQTLCVAEQGKAACPSSYPVPHAVGDGGTPYTDIDGVTDGRGCTCSCGAPSGVVCASGVTLYGPPACTDAGVVPVEAGTACFATTGAIAATSSWTADGGSCTPYGSPTGELTPGPAYTVCCTR